MRKGTTYCRKKGDSPVKGESPVNEQINKSEVGDHRSVGIPGNIPNPAVKRVSADGTWRAASWESKKLPTSLFLFNAKGTLSRQWNVPPFDHC